MSLSDSLGFAANFVPVCLSAVTLGVLICVLLIPSMVCVLWMSVFGGTAIYQVIADGYTAAQGAELPVKLFKMLDVMPLAGITSLVGIVLVIVFFVTSSDSGSLVIDTITAGGKVDAPVPQRAFSPASSCAPAPWPPRTPAATSSSRSARRQRRRPLRRPTRRR